MYLYEFNGSIFLTKNKIGYQSKWGRKKKEQNYLRKGNYTF